jgi:HEAT repeat protein
VAARGWRLPLLATATALAAVPVALGCWLGTRDRPQAGGVEPESILTAAIAAAAPAGCEAPAPEEDSLRVTPPPSEERAAAPAPPTAEPPPAPPSPPPDEESKPEPAVPPAAAPAPPVPAAPAKAPPARRASLPEDQLRKQLLAAPEFRLSPSRVPALVRAYRAQYANHAALSGYINFDPYTLLRYFPEVGMLPLRPAADAQLGTKEARTLGILARKLHAYLDVIAPKDRNGQRQNPTVLRETLRRERRGQRPEWLRVEAVPAMRQILMAEDVPLRLVLVDLLSEIEAKPATVALAQRAVFDLAPQVRQAALDALRGRPRSHYRQTLVDALRYPWPPAADHAADALVTLDDEEAVPLLVAQLDKPDPAAPFPTGKKGTAVRYLVRINHRSNCLLCHPPAVGGDDLVVDVDPFARVPPAGGCGGGGSGGSGWGGRGQPLLIGADVQFLQQDFSVSFPVGVPGIAVTGRRFDYLIAARLLTRSEARTWREQPPPEPTDYPQRDATLFALRALTGKDVGPTTAAWRQLYPHADAEAEGVRLSATLMKTAPARREQLLARWRDAKDDNYTAGLARAIPRLPPSLQERAREALVGRLLRLPTDQLRARLLDDDDQLRLAAGLACGRKDDRDLVPDLIGLLLALEPELVAGARQNLQRLTGKDFGPPADAPQEERVAAAAEWQAWWSRQATP